MSSADDFDTVLRDDLVAGFIKVVKDRLSQEYDDETTPSDSAAETLEAAAVFMFMMLVGFLRNPRPEVSRDFHERLWDAIMRAQQDHAGNHGPMH
jgi:hypothetical protein